MSKTINITQAKADGVSYFSEFPVEERLSMAQWTPDRMYRTLSDKLGNLYYGQVRIWITPDGSLYANKPKSGKGID